VLQDLKFLRVGGHELLEVDTRVIAATNRDLEPAMARGEFRKDLYYRLNVVEIQVPPLRERREEIPELASQFLARFNSQYGRQKQLMPGTLARLTEYSWLGNVRELENVIRRLVVLGEQPIEALVTRGRNGHSGHCWPPRPTVAEGGLREIGRRGAREAERTALVEVLERVSWNRRRGRVDSQGQLQDAAYEDLRVRPDATSSSLTGRDVPRPPRSRRRQPAVRR
jgi:two-component system, NtrC family, response regulator AtoC